MTKTKLGIFSLLTALLAWTCSAYADDAPPYKVVRRPVQESNGIVSFFLNSPYMNGENRIQLIRPNEKTNRILYLLPVTPWPGFEDKWKKHGAGMTEILKHDFHNRFGYNVVVPDFPENMPWFVDHASDAKRRHESYMLKVVIPFMDSILKIEEPVRDLAGFSKAGFGTLSLLLRYPDVFHAGSAWDPGGLLKTYDPESIGSLSHAVGSKERFEYYQLDKSLGKNARHFRQKKRIAISGYSSDAFMERLRAMHGFLEKEKVPHIYTEAVQVEHHWFTGWMEQALESLRKMQE